MPRDLSRLNATYAGDAEGALRFALSGALGRFALVSSFGADSAVLLHMAAQIDRAVPVLFIDTLMLFPETLAYQRDLAAHLGLTGVRVIAPSRPEMFAEDPDGVLHRAQTDPCCALRKIRPLVRRINDIETQLQGEPVEALRERTARWRAELARYLPVPAHRACGAVAEWSKAHAWKVCIR